MAFGPGQRRNISKNQLIDWEIKMSLTLAYPTFTLFLYIPLATRWCSQSGQLFRGITSLIGNYSVSTVAMLGNCHYLETVTK